MALKARHMKELQDFQNQMHEEIKERAQALGFDLSETEPIYDGVCDLEGYSKSKPKIMFILKEAWDEIGEGGPKGGGWEIYEPWESMDRMNDTWKILMYIVYGVRTGEDYNSMPWANEEMLDMLDVLVDGRFEEDLKDITLRFRGSSNQRLIDLPATRAAGEVVLWDDGGHM